MHECHIGVKERENNCLRVGPLSTDCETCSVDLIHNSCPGGFISGSLSVIMSKQPPSGIRHLEFLDFSANRQMLLESTQTQQNMGKKNPKNLKLTAFKLIFVNQNIISNLPKHASQNSVAMTTSSSEDIDLPYEIFSR